jgi:hypothetical protein
MIRRSETLLILGVLLGICKIAPAPAMATKVEGSEKVPVPADFPKDFPIYRNATVRSYGPIILSNPDLGKVLVLQTPDPKASVLAFYKTELPANGWTLQTFSGAPDSLAASKADRRISVSVTESQSGAKRSTRIELSVNGTS